MEEKELGKKTGTSIFGNSLYVKKFENGCIIKKKGQTELLLDKDDMESLALNIRHYSKYCPLYTHVEVSTIKKRFADNKEVCDFVDKVLKDQLTYEELNGKFGVSTPELSVGSKPADDENKKSGQA